MELEAYLGSPLACCRPGVDASPILSLDGRVFIAGYKYSQKVLIKRCCYCSTKLEMLEVSAGFLALPRGHEYFMGKEILGV